jgi:hypothetical protein
MSLPSKKRIEEWFHGYFRHEGIEPSRGAALIRAAIEESEEEGDEDIALEFVNTMFHGHGIEAIQGEYHVGPYHQNIVALYVNFGDPYVPTLLFETEPALFRLTSWGDWVERNELKYRIE